MGNNMLLPCEIAVKSLVPTLKALIAKEMVGVHGLRQEEAAKLLGTTQSAISQYLRGVRSRALKLDENVEARSRVSNIANMLIEHSVSREKIMTEFCRVCTLLRKEGLICDMHRHLEPQLNVEKCQLCSVVSSCFME